MSANSRRSLWDRAEVDDERGMGANRPVRDSAFAVILRGSRVLIVRTKRGQWQLPGGGLERGEAHWDAARREVREETGLRAEICGITGIFGRPDRSRAVVFAARVRGRAECCGPRNEIREQRWVQPHVAARLLKKSSRHRLRSALRSPKSFGPKKKSRVPEWNVALRRSG